MKYMLLTYLDEKAWLALTPEQQKEEMELCGPHIQKMMAAKKIIAGAPLRETATATTVKLREGKFLLTDGPFAETREQLGGYYLVEAKDLDEAIGIAARIPSVRIGTIEVRPVMEIPAAT